MRPGCSGRIFFADLPTQASDADQPDTGNAQGMAEPTASLLSPALPTVAQDDLALLARRETIELVRAYYGIEDSGTRRRVLDLVRSMGAS